MKLLSLKQQKNLVGGAAWIVGSLILITFFDIIKISLDSYDIAQKGRKLNYKNPILEIEQKNEMLYV